LTLNLLDRLFPGRDAVLLDGAMGTSLLEQGWPVSEPTLLANLHQPGLVASVHVAHREAGARVLHTNTFGALTTALTSGKQRTDAVAAAVRIARKAAGGQAKLAGALAAWDLPAHVTQLEDVVRALLDEGIDMLVFETCNTVRDALLAIEVHAELASRVPAVLCLSSTDGTREDAKRIEECATRVLGAETGMELGLNCCRGPTEAFKLALALPAAPRWCKPNTGPADEPVDDNVMAAFARAARQRGVRFLGGCCGTGPETLLVMAAALDALGD